MLHTFLKKFLWERKELSAEVCLGSSFGLCSGLCKVYLTNKNGIAVLMGRWSDGVRPHEQNIAARLVSLEEFFEFCVKTEHDAKKAVEELKKAKLLEKAA